MKIIEARIWIAQWQICSESFHIHRGRSWEVLSYVEWNFRGGLLSSIFRLIALFSWKLRLNEAVKFFNVNQRAKNFKHKNVQKTLAANDNEKQTSEM